MPPTLFAWIGQNDLNASGEKPDSDHGPILAVVNDRTFDRIVLLCNYEPERGRKYVAWLRKQTSTPVDFQHCQLPSPTDYRSIYEQASKVTGALSQDRPLAFHLSPGTPAMATVWVILAWTIYTDRSELLQSSKEQGVETVDLPFDIYAKFGPRLLSHAKDELIRLTQGLPDTAPEFDEIIHRCQPMKEAVAMARRLAPFDVPVLIQGESGTGKELFAKAIHQAGPRARADKPLVPVNCGAIPSELIDSYLFGHVKGAFTGAQADRKGFFEKADGGTLFLDEVGELSMPAQVRLLRAIQEGQIVPVGATEEREVDIRVIAATHQDLLARTTKGTFREDLFYRLAVGIIKLPPLRQRDGDLMPIVDHLLTEINTELQASGKGKKISAGARSAIRGQPWPGNVRELKNVLVRAFVRANGDTITKSDVERSLFSHPMSSLGILDRPLGQGFNLNELAYEVQRIYIRRALEQAENRTQAATELLGFNSLKNLTDRMKKIDYDS